MITYNRTAFGVNLVWRVHGSAVYRSILPSLISVGIFLMIRAWSKPPMQDFGEDLGHPYAIGVLVASTTFLIVFRANQGYARYWEGASATHHMMSKWMDATVHSCVYHLQCDHYKDIKPPSYFDYEGLNHLNLTRHRERGLDYPDDSEYEDDFDASGEDLPSHEELHSGMSNSDGNPNGSSRRGRSRSRGRSSIRASINRAQGYDVRASQLQREHLMRSVVKSINKVDNQSLKIRKLQAKEQLSNTEHGFPDVKQSKPARSRSMDDIDWSQKVSSNEFSKQYFEGKGGIQHGSIHKPFPLLGKPRLDGNWGAYFSREDPVTHKKIQKATFFDINNPDAPIDPMGFASMAGGQTPPLFLQELAHLSSLLVAVALSTLRNDIEGAESPLAVYEPGQPWPEVDPDKDEWIKFDRYMPKTLMFTLGDFLGMGRRPKEQTRYNAARPLPVIGGISDAEIRFLQMARGPYAKTQLCWNWLSEFCIREHLAGSMGNVGPPIISRIIQFLGDGMIFYNHARKIMFIPFPFVHAQLSVIFILVMVPCIPFLMDQYTDQVWLGSILTFFTVLCLSGINEVARELENPFRNVPNELPLVTLQAQYNEALITMYSGYHPDHFWDGDRVLKKRGGATAKAKGGAGGNTSPTKASAPGAGTTQPAKNRSSSPMESPLAKTPVPSPNSSEERPPATGTTRNGNAAKTDKEDGSGRDGTAEEEIANLKCQLAEQAKMIEQLAAKMNLSASSPSASSSPEEVTKKVEFITEQAMMRNSSI